MEPDTGAQLEHSLELNVRSEPTVMIHELALKTNARCAILGTTVTHLLKQPPLPSAMLGRSVSAEPPRQATLSQRPPRTSESVLSTTIARKEQQHQLIAEMATGATLRMDLDLTMNALHVPLDTSAMQVTPGHSRPGSVKKAGTAQKEASKRPLSTLLAMLATFAPLALPSRPPARQELTRPLECSGIATHAPRATTAKPDPVRLKAAPKDTIVLSQLGLRISTLAQLEHTSP